MPFEELGLIGEENKEKELDEIAQEIEDYYKQDIADKLLRAQVWDEAIRFCDGDQHIEYSISTNRFQPVTITRNNDFVPRPTTNYILPIVRTIVSRLTKQKPQAKVRPNSQDPRDIGSAKVSDLVLDVKYEELREEEKQQEKAYWGVITGTVFKKIFWDENTFKVIKIPRTETVIETITDEQGNLIPQEREQTKEEEFNVGDVGSSVIPPFNIAFALNTRSPLEMEWIMEYSVQKLDWIKKNYNKKEKGYTGRTDEVKEEKGLSVILQYEYKLRTLTGRNSGGYYSTGSGAEMVVKNSAVLKEYYQKPTEKYPRGRMIVVANGIPLYNGDSPYYADGFEDSWHPYVEWRFEIVPGRAWGKGLVEELIPINRRINAIDSLIILNRRTMAIAQWLIPEGSGVPNGFINGRPGLNITYRPVGANGAKPEKVEASALPQQVYQERNQAVEDIKRLGMTQDVLEGTNPVGVKTAYQLEQLLENALDSLGAMFQRWEKSFEREETKKLLLISKKYKEPRVELGKKLKAINKDVTDIELEMFMGEDLRDNVNVRVEPYSSIPRSKAGENAVLRELVQGKVLDVVTNSINKKEFLEKMGIKGFEYQITPDVKRAQWENSIIENGDAQDLLVDPNNPQGSVLELDNHEIHIVIHSARMKDPNVSIEIRQLYITHIEEHLEYLKTGMQAQSGAPVTLPTEEAGQGINQEQAMETAMGGV